MRPNKLLLLALTILLAGTALANDPNPATLYSDRGAWPLYRQWNAAEARHFAAWIAHIFDCKANGTVEQRLAKLERVLTDPEMNLLLDPAFIGEPSNPQVDMESIRAMHRIVDCHKLVMSLAAYYSCRRGLPFMFSVVRSFDGTDIRTAPATYPVFASSSFEYNSAHQVFVDATVGTCTGNLRVPAFGRNSELSDTCPVAIDPEYLIPGTVYYLDGHVLVLAKIEDSGNIRFLDATTSPTRDLYVFQGMNAVTGISPRRSDDPENPYGECFRGFRVLRFPIAETNADGKVVRVRRRTDAEMAEFGFSTEQYARMEELVSTGRIVENGLSFESMHQFIRYRLRGQEPLRVAEMIRRAADDAKRRMTARESLVQAAWAEVRANGPIPFPDQGSSKNIYNVGGRWGAFATALTDTEFRAAYFQFLGELDAAIPWLEIQTRQIDLAGLNLHAIWGFSDLAWALLIEKDRVFGETTFDITDSAGNRKSLSLLDVERRLYDMSFDPNHPPELRWGLPADSIPGTDAERAIPLASGKQIPLSEAYHRAAYYRSLAEWEVGETPILGMPLEGFPVRGTFQDHLWTKWRGFASPPIVPHGGRAAYEARTTTTLARR